MKIGKLFSRNSHMSFSLLFASLAFLVFSFNLPSFVQDSGLLALVVAAVGMVMFYSSLALNRRGWLIAPIIGIAITFVSVLYSSPFYPASSCGGSKSTRATHIPGYSDLGSGAAVARSIASRQAYYNSFAYFPA